MSDSYSKTASEEPGLTQKLTDARTFLGNHKTVLLTTRAPNGALHARTMAVAEITPDWKFRFIYDNESYKEKEVDNE
jgi:general stress protein 26